VAQSLIGIDDDLLTALKAGRWVEAVKIYERELSREEKLQAEFRVAYAIALIRTGRIASGIKILRSHRDLAAGLREDLRRWVVKPLIDEGSTERAIEVLDLLIASEVASVADLRLRASLLGRTNRRDAAIRDVERILAVEPEEVVANTQYLQLLLQSGRVAEAGAHAAGIADMASTDARLAHMALLALGRSGQHDRAAILAREAAERDDVNDALATAIVRALLEAASFDHGIEAGERFLAEGKETGTLHCLVGECHLGRRSQDRIEKAIEHLRVAIELDPRDFRSNLSLGEVLLRSGSYEDAVEYLEAATRLQPKVAQARALLARALKQCRRYSEAAVEFKRLIALQPSPQWHRYAAGALSQAGRKTEAKKLFDAVVAERSTELPDNFEDGLQALWERVDEVQLPQARLDWAWSMRREELTNDREEWERRAKWGHLADHYLLNWLECRSDRVHEPMERLADLGVPEAVLAKADLSNGLILASAHIGPMYAGPLALELLGIRTRWLASTPTVARTAYTKSLISTSEQEDVQVAHAFMRSLKQRCAVVIAVDGAINLAAPRIEFEGQEITYSSFAARTAHQMAVPSLFVAPLWQDGRIGFMLREMPPPGIVSDPEEYADLWRESYLGFLREVLRGAPENLRLSGGIWRHIR
jgi:tetratricopeptide (TPR) repeat protein